MDGEGALSVVSWDILRDRDDRKNVSMKLAI